jgi:arylsulfate sulfotransferase
MDMIDSNTDMAGLHPVRRGPGVVLVGVLLVLLAGCRGHDGAVREIHIGRHHNNALQIQIDAETPDSAVTFVRYWPDSAGETHALVSPPSPKGMVHSMVLLNMLPDTKYSFRVVVKKPSGEESTKPYPFTSPALPFWLTNQFKYSSDSLLLVPEVFRQGFMLINKRETPGVDYIVDYKGRIRWYQTVDGTGFKVTHFTRDQTIVSILGRNDEPTSYGSEILETNLEGDTLVYLKKGTGDLQYPIHHEILKNDQGQFITLFVDRRIMDLRKAGGGEKDTVNGDGIVILDRSGHTVWRWSVFDVIDPLKDPHITATRRDWMHANSVNFDKDGNFILSFYNNGQIWKVDAHTGRVWWKFGKGGDFSMPAECTFSQAHAVHINRQGSLMFFDNGVENHLSEVFAVKLNEKNKTASLDLHIKLPPDVYNDRMGSAYMITDSTVLCCSSKRKITVLVNRKGVLLWDMETAIPPYRVEFLQKEQVSPWLQP